MLNDVEKKAGEIFQKYNGFEAFDCTTREQLEAIEELLNSSNLKGIAQALSDHKPRRNNYIDDKKSYMGALHKALKLFNQYNPNDGMPIMRQNFEELIYVGLSEPMTDKEIKDEWFTPLIVPRLEEVNISKKKIPALKNKIIEYHYNQ